VAGAGAEAETEAASVLAVRACAKELHTAFGLRPLARATAPWGAAKLGVDLSSLGFALQHAQRRLQLRLELGQREAALGEQLEEQRQQHRVGRRAVPRRGAPLS
jgi:hypothetical protein